MVCPISSSARQMTFFYFLVFFSVWWILFVVEFIEEICGLPLFPLKLLHSCNLVQHSLRGLMACFLHELSTCNPMELYFLWCYTCTLYSIFISKQSCNHAANSSNVYVFVSLARPTHPEVMIFLFGILAAFIQ